MSLFPSLRATLWRTPDWRNELGRMADALAADVTEATFTRAVELGHAFELIEPDRNRAVAMFVVAARGGRTDAVPHAQRLAREIGAHGVLAELALAKYLAD